MSKAHVFFNGQVFLTTEQGLKDLKLKNGQNITKQLLTEVLLFNLTEIQAASMAATKKSLPTSLVMAFTAN